ncbi:hypothetical protein NQ317_019318 [Molorchus minor]|uniref:DNA helicase n=1 Tax=Molorchus minor TaxID=1323400 RepID=A0ABQ9J4Y6_9CUCU|nr:hypothetical protein NQ317_019318 [Molorchus minor]
MHRIAEHIKEQQNHGELSQFTVAIEHRQCMLCAVAQNKESVYSGGLQLNPVLADGERILKNVQCFEQYLQSIQGTFSATDVLNNRFFTVDYESLIADDHILSDWDDLKTDLIDNTEFSLNCMGLAMYQFILKHKKSQEQGDSINKETDMPFIRARLINYEPILQLKHLKVNYYGKLVSIKGTVIKAGQVKIICQYLAFACCSCSGTQLVKQVDGLFSSPISCPTRGCKVISNFVGLYDSPFTRTISWQSIKIQELLGIEQFSTF